MEQLALGVRLRAASNFASFEPGDNEALLEQLVVRSTAAGLPPLWVWAAAGAGRSHLLQAVCARAAEHGRRPAYLPCGAAWLSPAMLSGLETLAVVCLDDLEQRAGDDAWERALFALYNDLAERGGTLIASAAVAPAAVGFQLADLSSRFAASVVWQLKPLPESRHAAVLTSRARTLGIELPAETLQYLLRRLPRELGPLCEALERLDSASLSQQRRLTVPFVRSVLGLSGD